jgi:hypothetical protein
VTGQYSTYQSRAKLPFEGKLAINYLIRLAQTHNRLAGSVCISPFQAPAMPLKLPHDAPTLLIRKRAFEQYALTRADFDLVLHLTDEEFRVEGDLVSVGPVYDAEGLAQVIAQLESRGLSYFDDFFDFSGNWPGWLMVYVMAQIEKPTDHGRT